MFGKNISILSKLTLYNRVREAQLVNCGEGGGGGPIPPAYSIASFTISQTQAEVGATITNLILNWSYGPSNTNPDTSQSINQGVGTIANNLRTANTGVVDTLTGASKIWTLTTNHLSNIYTANTTINFRRKIYWGISTNASLGAGPISVFNGALTGFSSELATSRLTTKNFDCSGGRYIYFIYPASFGTNNPNPHWSVNGFPVTLSNVNTVNLTNAFNNDTVSYIVQRSTNLLYGSSINVQVL